MGNGILHYLPIPWNCIVAHSVTRNILSAFNLWCHHTWINFEEFLFL
jgi:hypothetical protein